MTRAQKKLRTESRKDNRAISMGAADYNNNGFEMEGEDDEVVNKPSRRSISINITEEALRIGKLPTENVAKNMA